MGQRNGKLAAVSDAIQPLETSCYVIELESLGNNSSAGRDGTMVDAVRVSWHGYF